MKKPKFANTQLVKVCLPVEQLREFSIEDIERISKIEYHIKTYQVEGRKVCYFVYENPGLLIDEDWLYDPLNKEKSSFQDILNGAMSEIDCAIKNKDKEKFKSLSRKYALLKQEE
jgi:hypothetical protein